MLATRLLALCAAVAGVAALAGLPAAAPRALQLYFGDGSLPLLPLAGLLVCCLPPLLISGAVGDWLGERGMRALRVACGLVGLGIAACVLLTTPAPMSCAIGSAGLITFAAINLLEPLVGARMTLRLALRLSAILPLCLGLFELLQALTGFSLAEPALERAGIGTLAALLMTLLACAFVVELAPPRSLRNEASVSASRILATACATLIVMVAVARLSALASMHQNAERFNTDFMRHAQAELARGIAGEIAHADALAEAMLASDDTASFLRALRQPGAAQHLQRSAQRLLTLGASHVEYRVARASVVAAGTSVTPTLALPLSDSVGRELAYQRGFFLRTRKILSDAAGVVGEVYIELPVPGIQERFDALRASLSGTRIALCALRGAPPRCFPTGPDAADTVRHLGPALTMALRAAAQGASGTAPATASDGMPLLSAYGPVESLGLGLTIARDWQQIVLPLRRQMLFGIALLVLASVVAILIMRARVLPLVRGLIAARRAAEASEARFLAASENSPDGFTVLDAVRDATGRIVDFRLGYLNGAASRFWNAPASRVVGQLISRLVPEIEELGILERYRHVVATGESLCEESPVITPDVASEWVEQLVVKLNDGVTVTFRDITERKRNESRLKHLAQSDGLTGLPNRAVFYDRLETALMRARRTHRAMALMFIDIDHFKAINDNHGHAGGDALLRKFSERLRREVRKSDTVARLAGDEFTVILEELHDRADADKVAGGILKAVNMPLTIGEREIQITSSIGIALYEGEAITANELLDRADIALYAVKRAGRNACVIYSREIDTRGDRDGGVEVTCLSGSWKQL